jgi:hypothetical protein
VLLSSDRNRGRPIDQAVAGELQSGPPGLRVAFGARRVRRAALPDDGAVGGLTEQHLGGLGGGIYASDEHLLNPHSTMASEKHSERSASDIVVWASSTVSGIDARLRQ